MNLAWLYLFNVVLLSRLPWIWQDGRLRAWPAFALCAFQEVALFAVFGFSRISLLLGLVLALIASVWAICERNGKKTLGKRLVALAAYFVIIGLFCSNAVGLHIRGDLHQGLVYLGNYFVPIQALLRVNWPRFGGHALGALLCLGEANLLVRYAIEWLDLRPTESSKKGGVEISPTVEYNRGRIIGILERITFFVLVSLGQFSGIGFVLAGKAMARFQNLDDRNFAEYFLVGTLLSLVIAGALALLTQRLL
jgi:hypothetical protein